MLDIPHHTLDNCSYASVFHCHPFAMSITTIPEGLYVDVNAAWVKTTGYARHEVIGKTAAQLNIWEEKQYRDFLTEKMKAAGGFIGNIRVYFRTRNGEVHASICSCSLITIDDRPHLLWVVNYVFDPENLQNRLLRDERFNQALLMHSSNLIVICDPQGRILRVNDTCLAMTGCTREELACRYYWEMMSDPAEIEIAKAIFSRTDEGLVMQDQHVNRWKAQDSRIHTISWTTTYLYEPDIGTAYIINIGTDITDQRAMQDRLREREAELRGILENASGIIFTMTAEGKLLYISPGWTEMLGHKPGEIEGQHFHDLIHPDQLAACQAALKHIVETGTAVKDIEYKIRHKDGSWRWHSCSGGVARDENDQVLYYIGIAMDITDRIQAHEDLRLSEDKFAKAFNAGTTALSICTVREGRFIDANDTFCRILGYQREELLGKTVFELEVLASFGDRIHIYEKVLAKQPIRNMEIVFRKKSGELRLGCFSGEGIDVNRQFCVLGILTDITEQKRAEQEIKYLSFHDKLTGLYNRAYFEEALGGMDAERNLPISIIMGDVNGLKVLNDTLGHHEGDQLLRTVADVLKESCREEDIVARWGGDEFVILLPNCPEESAYQVIDRIKDHDLTRSSLPVKNSIALGTACKTQNNQNLIQVMKQAEDGMYRNKLVDGRWNSGAFLRNLESTLLNQQHETRVQSRRMQELAERFGAMIHLSENERENLGLLTALHDIGKIAVSGNSEEGSRPRRDDPDVEFKHPETGYRIALSIPELAPIATEILHHHECWDGSGYPLGLQHEEIPLLARIIALIDAYDVMVYGRPLQKPVSREEAWQKIQEGAGTIYDPHLVQIMALLLSD